MSKKKKKQLHVYVSTLSDFERSNRVAVGISFKSLPAWNVSRLIPVNPVHGHEHKSEIDALEIALKTMHDHKERIWKRFRSIVIHTAASKMVKKPRGAAQKAEVEHVKTLSSALPRISWRRAWR